MKQCVKFRKSAKETLSTFGQTCGDEDAGLYAMLGMTRALEKQNKKIVPGRRWAIWKTYHERHTRKCILIENSSLGDGQTCESRGLLQRFKTFAGENLVKAIEFVKREESDSSRRPCILPMSTHHLWVYHRKQHGVTSAADGDRERIVLRLVYCCLEATISKETMLKVGKLSYCLWILNWSRNHWIVSRR